MQLSTLFQLALVAASTVSAATCSANRITHLENHVEHPAQFCQFWLRGGVMRTYSALPGQTAGQLTETCQCYLADRGLSLHPIKRYTAPTSGTCDATLANLVAAEFSATRYFCEYYVNDQVRSFTPVKALTPQNIFDGCECYISLPTTTSSTVSTTTSTSSASSTDTSAPTTTTTSTPTTMSTVTTTVASSGTTIPTNSGTGVYPTGTATGTGVSPTGTGSSGADANPVRRTVEELMVAYMEQVNGAEEI